MLRRDVFRLAYMYAVGLLGLSLTGCGSEELSTRASPGLDNGTGDEPSSDDATGTETDPPDTDPPVEEDPTKPDEEQEYVTMYDTYAMALYFGRELGPKTGVIKVDYILEDKERTMQFWHGHGGQQHQFTLTPEHFAELKQGKKIYINTTDVQGHSHELFIDPSDPQWRVPGAEPVEVPV